MEEPLPTARKRKRPRACPHHWDFSPPGRPCLPRQSGGRSHPQLHFKAKLPNQIIFLGRSPLTAAKSPRVCSKPNTWTVHTWGHRRLPRALEPFSTHPPACLARESQRTRHKAQLAQHTHVWMWMWPQGRALELQRSHGPQGPGGRCLPVPTCRQSRCSPGTNGITSRPHAACENTGLYVSSLPQRIPWGGHVYVCARGRGDFN